MNLTNKFDVHCHTLLRPNSHSLIQIHGHVQKQSVSYNGILLVGGKAVLLVLLHYSNDNTISSTCIPINTCVLQSQHNIT